MQKVVIQEFLNLAERFPVVDVRSPGEFEKGHIPGACNIPLFDDVERAKIGTVYKKVNQDKALMEGLDIAGRKMKDYVTKARKIAYDDRLLIYCWRGGRRSESLAWLFDFSGMETIVLSGGYKSYRRYIRRQFSEKAKMVILGGMTGTGKSEILKELKDAGEQVIDLEGLARHKGSAFGGFGEKEQPTNEQFENNLYTQWRHLNLNEPVWVEDESHSVGKIFIPDPLFLQMREAPVIVINFDQKYRLERLVKEYAGYDKEDLKHTVLKIKKRLGPVDSNLAIQAIEKENYHDAAALILHYYDKAYRFGQSKRNAETLYPLFLEVDDPKKNAGIIMDFARKKNII